MAKRRRPVPGPDPGPALYAWRAGSRVPVDPSVAKSELDEINRLYGAVTPALVLERARDATAPLHAAFEWTDSVAAQKYRESQAGYIIRSLVVVYRKAEGELTQPVRYLAIKLRRAEGDPRDASPLGIALAPRNYLPISQVMSNDQLRERLLLQAFRDLVSWRSRYNNLVELQSVFSAIDEVAEVVRR